MDEEVLPLTTVDEVVLGVLEVLEVVVVVAGTVLDVLPATTVEVFELLIWLEVVVAGVEDVVVVVAGIEVVVVVFGLVDEVVVVVAGTVLDVVPATTVAVLEFMF